MAFGEYTYENVLSIKTKVRLIFEFTLEILMLKQKDEMVPFTTPDTSNLRHMKAQTMNIGLPTTQQINIPFHISIEILF